MESVHVLLAQVGVAFQKLFFGAKRDAHGISASENILLDISFSPIKEGLLASSSFIFCQKRPFIFSYPLDTEDHFLVK